ncbi:hypothetical protein D3C85_1803440 [compost metagenome]
MVVDADDVDALEEVVGLLNSSLKLLLDGRGDVEALGSVGHAVEFGDVTQHSVVYEASFVTHW